MKRKSPRQYKGGSPRKVKVPQGYMRKAIRQHTKRIKRGKR